MNLRMKKYMDQVSTWPNEGKHILGQYNDDYIVVYQAYRQSIGEFAATNQFFGGDFSYNRMTWIKPNFLWMMYRSGWGTKPGQEITLAIKLKKDVFDDYLASAVASSYAQTSIDNHEAWKQAVGDSDVRLQWDPDHHPTGAKEVRKAIQLGVRGSKLEPFKGGGIVEIEDISDFVNQQRELLNNNQMSELMVPEESVYVPSKPELIKNIKLDVI